MACNDNCRKRDRNSLPAVDESDLLRVPADKRALFVALPNYPGYSLHIPINDENARQAMIRALRAAADLLETPATPLPPLPGQLPLPFVFE